MGAISTLFSSFIIHKNQIPVSIMMMVFVCVCNMFLFNTKIKIIIRIKRRLLKSSIKNLPLNFQSP